MALIKMETLELEEKGVILAEKGKLSAAEAIFKEILARDRRNLGAHFELARIYRRLNLFEKAIYHSHCVLKLNPLERNAHLNLGLIYENKKNIRLARLYYKKELKLNPYSGAALFNIGFSYFDHRSWKQAACYLERCFKVGFRFERERLVEALAFCYHKQRRDEKYLQLFREYLLEEPKSGWAAFNIGNILMTSGDFKNSALMFDKARRLGFLPEKAAERFKLAKKSFLIERQKDQ